MYIQTLRDIFTHKEQLPNSLIGSGVLLQQTKLVLYGAFKAGKSTLIQYLAMCLAGGLPLFGAKEFPTQRSLVYYIQLEMPQIPFHRRLRHSALSKLTEVRENLYVTTEFWLKLDTSEGRKMLEDAISQIRPTVVIIDPLYKCMVGNEDYEHLTLVYDHMDLMMEKYKFSFMFTAQGRKTQVIPSGAIDLGDQELRGSTATGGWVDSIIGLRRMEGTKRKLTGTLRHGVTDTFDITINFDPVSALYTLAHG